MIKGKQSLLFETPPGIICSASIVGKKEGDGPFGNYFDNVFSDPLLGKKTWEQAESEILKETVNGLIKKSNNVFSDIDYIFAGDLLNQCVGSTFGLMKYKIPFAGVYGACSTMALSLIMVGSS